MTDAFPAELVLRIAKIVCEQPWGAASVNTRNNAMITARAVLRELGAAGMPVGATGKPM